MIHPSCLLSWLDLPSQLCAPGVYMGTLQACEHGQNIWGSTLPETKSLAARCSPLCTQISCRLYAVPHALLSHPGAPSGYPACGHSQGHLVRLEMAVSVVEAGHMGV